MTAQRQERYGWRPGIAFFALLAGVFASFGLDLTAQAQTTERVVVNRYSGLAIEGFDPVAYFTDAAGDPGRRPISRRPSPAPSGASATRATAPRLSPIPRSMARSSAATIRSISGAASPMPAIRDSGWSRANGSICSAARKAAMPSPPTRRASSKTPAPAGRPSNRTWRRVGERSDGAGSKRPRIQFGSCVAGLGPPLPDHPRR